MDASGFFPEPALSNAEGVEMTDVGLTEATILMQRAHVRHSEPWAKNPEASSSASTSHATALRRIRLIGLARRRALARVGRVR
jgi:hypothetical protein